MVCLLLRRRPDPEGPIEILEKLWQFPSVEISETSEATPDVAPPLLIYADLLASRDPRNIELAKMIKKSISIMLKINQARPLDPIALKILQAVKRATQESGIATMIVDATARDILLTHVFGLPVQRATADIDFAIAVKDWS